MSGVTIRAATAADIPAVRHLLVRTWHDTYDAIFGAERVTAITDDWHSERNLARAFDRPNHRFLVAVTEGGRLAGTASSTLHAAGRLALDRLYIDPSLQRIGLGTGLMAAAIADWPGLRRVDLEVEPRNLPAVRFYRRHGFVPLERGPCGGHADSIRMGRCVPPHGYGVRLAEPGDVDAIRRVSIAAIRTTCARDYDAATVEHLAADVTAGKVASQVAQWDVWVVTDLEGAVCASGAFDGTSVRRLFVDPPHQGRGLAHVLMDVIEGAAYDAGLPGVTLRSSLTARPFFASRGYLAGETLAFGPAEMVAMSRPLLRS